MCLAAQMMDCGPHHTVKVHVDIVQGGIYLICSAGNWLITHIQVVICISTDSDYLLPPQKWIVTISQLCNTK